MLNFCTYFDSNYLLRGLAMYYSLIEHCPKCHLYIFAFDDKSLQILSKLNLSNATIISLKEFEDEQLLTVKPKRNKVEYYWTCTPSTILYAIKKFDLEMCTYLDADLLFFASPQILLDELKNNAILLTEHRYPAVHDKTFHSGKYCVQFITFKNNEQGLKALTWWREACLNWCYARPENGKFGDQRYLDDWLERFSDVHVLQNLGGGVAPWNVLNYDFFIKDRQLYGREIVSGREFKLIFFHFHHTNIYNVFGSIKVSYFQPVNKPSELLAYRQYEKYLRLSYKKIKPLGADFNFDKTRNYFIITLKNKCPNIIKKIYRYIIYGKKN